MLKKILSLLASREKRDGIYLLILVVLLAIIEAFGIFSLLPFVTVLTNPQIIESNTWFAGAYKLGRYQNSREFLADLGALCFLMLVISLVLKSLTQYSQIRFALRCEYSIGKRLIEGYLSQPYEWFLGQQSANLGRKTLSLVSEVVTQVIFPLISLISQGFLAFVIIVLLLIVEPKPAILLGIFLVGAYALLTKLSIKYVSNLGVNRQIADSKRHKYVAEAFNAVKEIKVNNIESLYINQFKSHALQYAKCHANATIISQLPRHAIECLVFGVALLIILLMIGDDRDLLTIAPIFALYIFAGYRLLPSLQQIYAAFSQLKFSSHLVNILYEDIKDFESPGADESKKTRIAFLKALHLQAVSYSYSDNGTLALKNISIEILRGKHIGLTGPSGSGKTTLIDVLIGLLPPDKGNFLIDNVSLSSYAYGRWARSIGYVPQQIFLTEDSILENITLGVAVDEIDHNRVKYCAVTADLYDFVINELPHGFLTKIGDRGVRLSGGQRQRIGIARALYKNPTLLVLDEATSSLDNESQDKIIDRLVTFDKNLTIVSVAHRIAALKRCDYIYVMRSGELTNRCSYQALLSHSFT
jgi:ABC-type bacteriocin/lantibiotic exporter with double-glycine peptidase domain